MVKDFKSKIGIQNLVVAKYRNGRMVKGVTYNFGAEKKSFHVHPLKYGEGRGGLKRGIEVSYSDLKAIFFVKSLEGRKQPVNISKLLEEDYEESRTPMKVKVTFFDGETLIGTTYGYNREREGFFLLPLEKDSNNIRVFVIFNSVKEIEFLS